IKIPPYSPDINVIEHVWCDMSRYINKKYCDNIEKLRSRENKFVRQKFTQQRCQNHIRKLREILQGIINRNGDWTRLTPLGHALTCETIEDSSAHNNLDKNKSKENSKASKPSTSSSQQAAKSDSNLTLNEQLLTNMSEKIDSISEIRDNSNTIKDLLSRLVSEFTSQKNNKNGDESEDQNDVDENCEHNEDDDNETELNEERNENRSKANVEMHQRTDPQPSSSNKSSKGSELNKKYYQEMELNLSKKENTMEYNALTKLVPIKIKLIEDAMINFVGGDFDEFLNG
ncbi:unnamed protein product, partial [Brachionus calyciflorus]